VCWAAERRFVSEARTPSAAREFVSSQLRRLLGPVPDGEPVDDAELVVSELVTNAVRAGAGTVRVGLSVHHGELQVDVTDDGPGWPRLVRPGEQDPRGRGLVLVDALADRWRAERIEGGGKRVRVTVAVPAEFTRTLRCDRPRADAVSGKG
jgi:anti-sigma regulatory factor (Ser/Thr protein kinase)